MTLIGIDDTDSRTGACTTHLMVHFILRAMELGWDVIGYPRLVRLNPNIPYKTRGNGALCVELGRGAGTRMLIGRWGEADLYGWSRSGGDEPPGTAPA